MWFVLRVILRLLRQYVRVHRHRGAYVARAAQRWLFVQRWRSLIAEMTAA